jgi:hypothetical protein
MRDDRMRSVIETRVALLVPWVYVGQARIDAVALDEEGGDHFAHPISRSSSALLRAIAMSSRRSMSGSSARDG